MADRTAQIVGSIDLTTTKGLELGPLTSPVVRQFNAARARRAR
jgi:hypothetical protein